MAKVWIRQVVGLTVLTLLFFMGGVWGDAYTEAIWVTICEKKSGAEVKQRLLKHFCKFHLTSFCKFYVSKHLLDLIYSNESLHFHLLHHMQDKWTTFTGTFVVHESNVMKHLNYYYYYLDFFFYLCWTEINSLYGFETWDKNSGAFVPHWKKGKTDQVVFFFKPCKKYALPQCSCVPAF